MAWTQIISYFLGGAFLTNALPHSIAGLMGEPFQSPFAKPPGEGHSSSTVNVLWGAFNAVIGYLLLFHVGDFDLRNIPHVATAGLGALVMSLMLARAFGRFNGGNI